MNKWFGKIGYIEQVQTAPSVWKPQETIREYFGDIMRNSSSWSANTDSTNDELTIDIQISVVSDPYAYQHFHSMKWVEYSGTRWKIKKVEPKYPRLILGIGGVYNG